MCDESIWGSNRSIHAKQAGEATLQQAWESGDGESGMVYFRTCSNVSFSCTEAHRAPGQHRGNPLAVGDALVRVQVDLLQQPLNLEKTQLQNSGHHCDLT